MIVCKIIEIQIKKLSSRSVSRVLVIFLIFNVYEHSWRVGSRRKRRIGSKLSENNDTVILWRRIGLRGAVSFIIHCNSR